MTVLLIIAMIGFFIVAGLPTDRFNTIPRSSHRVAWAVLGLSALSELMIG